MVRIIHRLEHRSIQNTALRTVTPDGKTVRLPPPAVATAHLESVDRCLPFAPAYGAQTDALLAEAGLAPDDIAALRDSRTVA